MPQYEIEYGGKRYQIDYEGDIKSLIARLDKILGVSVGKVSSGLTPKVALEKLSQVEDYKKRWLSGGKSSPQLLLDQLLDAYKRYSRGGRPEEEFESVARYAGLWPKYEKYSEIGKRAIQEKFFERGLDIFTSRRQKQAAIEAIKRLPSEGTLNQLGVSELIEEHTRPGFVRGVLKGIVPFVDPAYLVAGGAAGKAIQGVGKLASLGLVTRAPRLVKPVEKVAKAAVYGGLVGPAAYSVGKQLPEIVKQPTSEQAGTTAALVLGFLAPFLPSIRDEYLRLFKTTPLEPIPPKLLPPAKAAEASITQPKTIQRKEVKIQGSSEERVKPQVAEELPSPQLRIDTKPSSVKPIQEPLPLKGKKAPLQSPLPPKEASPLQPVQNWKNIQAEILSQEKLPSKLKAREFQQRLNAFLQERESMGGLGQWVRKGDEKKVEELRTLFKDYLSRSPSKYPIKTLYQEEQEKTWNRMKGLVEGIRWLKSPSSIKNREAGFIRLPAKGVSFKEVMEDIKGIGKSLREAWESFQRHPQKLGLERVISSTFQRFPNYIRYIGHQTLSKRPEHVERKIAEKFKVMSDSIAEDLENLYLRAEQDASIGVSELDELIKKYQLDKRKREAVARIADKSLDIESEEFKKLGYSRRETEVLRSAANEYARIMNKVLEAARSAGFKREFTGGERILDRAGILNLGQDAWEIAERAARMVLEKKKKSFRLNRNEIEWLRAEVQGKYLPEHSIKGITNAASRFYRLLTRLGKLRGVPPWDIPIHLVPKQMVEIEYAGHVHPRILSEEGRRAIRDILDVVVFDVPHLTLRQKKVIEHYRKLYEAYHPGETITAEEALRNIKRLASQALANPEGYIEKERKLVFMPPEWLEWDFAKTHPHFLVRSYMKIRGGEKFGQKLEKLEPYLEAVSHITTPAESEAIREVFEMGLGMKLPPTTDIFKSAIRFLSQHETFSKLTSPTTALRNLGQRFTNTVERPSKFVFKANWEDFKSLRGSYEPVFRRYLEKGIISPTVLGEQLIRSTRPDWKHPRQVIGWFIENVRSPNAILGELTSISMRPYGRIEMGNQFVSARAAELDLRALTSAISSALRLERKKGIGNIPWIFSKLTGRDIGGIRRKLERLGMSSSELMEILAGRQRMTEESVERALRMAAINEQFRETLISMPGWWYKVGVLPQIFRLMSKFKPFGVKQVGYIYGHVLKELRHGNVLPFVKFLGWTLFSGELYNVTRDILTGSENSIFVSSMRSPEDELKMKRIGERILNDMKDGGLIGILDSLMYGDELSEKIATFLLGPTLSTFLTLTGSATYTMLDPANFPESVRNYFSRNYAGVRTVEDIFQIFKRITKSTDKRIAALGFAPTAYYRHEVKAASDYVKRYIKETELYPTILHFPISPKTLPYRFAADAMLEANIQKAREYVLKAYQMNFGKVDAEEIDPERFAEFRTGIINALRLRGPRQGLSEKRWKEFLDTLSERQRHRFDTVDEIWESLIEEVVADIPYIRMRRRSRSLLRMRDREQFVPRPPSRRGVPSKSNLEYAIPGGR